MKNLCSFFAGLFCLVLSFNAKAQTQPPADYFVGKWNVIVEGTPGGEGKMPVALERKDGKLSGTIITRPGTGPTKVTRIDETEKSVTLYFNTNG